MFDWETLYFVDTFQHGSCLSYFALFIYFQPNYGGGSPNFDRNSPPATWSNFGIPSAPLSPCRCAKLLSRISDLEC
jgi:hypothetical protein